MESKYVLTLASKIKDYEKGYRLKFIYNDQENFKYFQITSTWSGSTLKEITEPSLVVVEQDELDQVINFLKTIRG